ncbi:MAG: peptidylprolyl isomerase [Campylobacteraceae bacterium]|nr:peptidylprolyl isomerase [Campylobacteraceae bacterium]
MIITKNCVVTLDYSVSDTEKNIIDSGVQPLIYLHGGYDDIFKKLELALEGKQIGDNIVVHMTPTESFGEYDEDLVVVEAKSEFDDKIFVGEQFEEIIEDEEEGELEITYRITQINEDTVTLDGNHPLAGLDIIFDATVMEVRKASAKEIKEEHAR